MTLFSYHHDSIARGSVYPLNKLRGITAPSRSPRFSKVAHPSILFSTTDIESAYEKMKRNGVEVGEMMRMPFGTMFTFKDQDGNEYLLREDK